MDGTLGEKIMVKLEGKFRFIEIGFWLLTRTPTGHFSLHKTFLKVAEEEPILKEMNEIADLSLSLRVILVAN